MKSSRKIIATIEARMTSSRLPGKVLMEAVNKPMLELMIERLRRVPSLDAIAIATTVNAADDPIEDLAKRLSVGCYRGSEEDVLQRVLDTAQFYEADIIVQLTGDCPLIDPEIIEHTIQRYLQSNVDYAANTLTRTYPIGMDTTVFATDILADVAGRTNDPTDREHVSLFIYRHPELYSLENYAAPRALTYPEMRLTLDTPEDLELIRAIFERLYPKNPEFTLNDILVFLDQNPEIVRMNEGVKHRYV